MNPFKRGLSVAGRVRRMRALFPVLGVVLLGAGGTKLAPEQIIKRWQDGPARYILTSQEEDDLRSLKSTAALARFINRFWEKRDPSPGTFENEYRRMFWQRVAEANRRFRVSTTPGWKTDRGKIFIMLGEPFDIESNMRGGMERWEYRRQHSRTADPVFYVAFTWNHGDLELSNDPRLMSPFYDVQGLVLDPGPVGGALAQAAIAEAPADIAQTALQANLDLGDELTAVVSNAEMVLATVSTRDFISAFAATPRFEFFRAKDGATFVNICGLMRASDLYGSTATGLTRHRIYVSLAPVDASVPTLFATNEKNPSTYDLSRGPEPGGLVAVWTGLAAPAGRYSVTMAIEDSLTGRLGRASADLQVPDLSRPALNLSTPVLASSLAEARDRVSVTARSSGVFRRSEDFGIYYEVYGLDAGAPFDTRYQFYRETSEGPRPIGEAVVFTGRTEASQGWSFPLSRWPAGKYLIEITAAGANGRSASARASFEVVE